MKINEKIKMFFIDKQKSNKEIGDLYGTSPQTVGNYLNGNRDIPTDFIVWLKKMYPEIDLNKLFTKDDITEIIVVDLKNNAERKREILREVDQILKKYLD
ncbi:MAG: hypothetical protein J6O88_06010 [Chryseobacterium sp.]|uniref:hypothetical protein n=1 Tax=Chryseobacterium sp. TaxID=1871047 RepID=UPI001B0EF455|nr:hypothetical protein [Chryseobacterium sp.]MBO6184237.1 hypothetical protein [Chryseobacterium sp.]